MSLNLNEALQVYDLIGKHIPELREGEDVLDFVGKIVGDIKENGTGTEYIDSVMIIVGVTDLTYFERFSPQDILSTFVEGLVNNEIIRLKSFCEQIGYNNG